MNYIMIYIMNYFMNYNLKIKYIKYIKQVIVSLTHSYFLNISNPIKQI